MCQRVSGPTVVLEERWAWKVFEEGLKPLIYSQRGKVAKRNHTAYRRNVWYKSTGVAAGWFQEYTAGGFHVFHCKSDAVSYMRNVGHKSTVVVKVRIRGLALPFNGLYGPGWAVHEMFIPEEG